MCGLAGVYATNFAAIEEDYFRKLLHLNVFRGEDSTGVIRVNHDGNSHSRRALLSSPIFLQSPTADIIKSNGTKIMALLGHTRHATKGAVSLKNAHPFNFDKIVGMHNGTIHKNFQHRNEYDTDSEALYRNINDYGLEAALNEVEAFDSAYALQFYDKKNKTINFIKNDKRPLYFTFLFAGTTMIWSSERSALEFLLRHKKYSTNVGWNGDTKEKFFTLEDHDLLSVKIGKNPMSESTLTRIEVKKKAHSGIITGATITGVSGASEWTKEADGVYRLRPKSALPPANHNQLALPSSSTNQRGKNSSTSPSQTSTITGGTSEPTKKQQGTSTRSASEEVVDKGGFRSFRDKYQDLKTLPWLGPDGLIPPGEPDDGDLSDPRSDLFGDLFDKNFADPVPGTEGEDVRGTGEVLGSPVECYIRVSATLSIKESEYAFRLQQGCSCCGDRFNMNDPHDYEAINKLRFADREVFFCEPCHSNEDNAWVRSFFADEWIEEAREVKVG